MKRTLRLPVASLVLFLPFLGGCTDLNLRDAFSAGVFDFVSGWVTSFFSGLLPVPAI